MDSPESAETDSGIAQLPENVQAELDRRLFHLKTLYDVSRELLGVVEIRHILKSFLLMTLGNFGVVEGFILVNDAQSKQKDQIVTAGIQDSLHPTLIAEARQLLTEEHSDGLFVPQHLPERFAFLPAQVACGLVFSIDEECRGCLGVGPKIVDASYSENDKALLETLVNNLIVSLKHARSAQALKHAYEELAILNRAKDKLIHHLSHELQTPVALLISSMKLLKKQLASQPEENWNRPLQRAERSLRRLTDMQAEVEDIILQPAPRNRNMMCRLLDQCSAELEVLAEEQTGDNSIAEKIRSRIEEIFGPKECVAEYIMLDKFVAGQIDKARPFFHQRQIEVITDLVAVPSICISTDHLEKLVIGLFKNAVEYTPDGGRIEIKVQERNLGVEFIVRDAGVGIVEVHQQHIFEGFFPTQETMAYSSKKAFDFNAGGKGADLLRLKLFSERDGFQLDMVSTRCPHIPSFSDLCPGEISQCKFCRTPEDCYNSGGTTFTALFSTSDV